MYLYRGGLLSRPKAAEGVLARWGAPANRRQAMAVAPPPGRDGDGAMAALPCASRAGPDGGRRHQGQRSLCSALSSITPSVSMGAPARTQLLSLDPAPSVTSAPIHQHFHPR